MKLRAALCAILVLGLGACISLFPKEAPTQLYRFGVVEAPAQAPAGPTFNVSRMPIQFSRAADGDRILTVNGTEAAYVAQARWDGPASNLFEEAEARAFDISSGPARLVRAGDSATAPASLSLDVQTFEASYPGDMKLAPTVVIRVHALLVNSANRQVMGDQVFESRMAATDNRVGDIVQAFDAATTDVLNQIVIWTGLHGAAT